MHLNVFYSFKTMNVEIISKRIDEVMQANNFLNESNNNVINVTVDKISKILNF